MINFLKQLIQCPSITPDDAGCQVILIDALKKMGFQIEEIPCGKVKNFWARLGKEAPLFAFAGHTDVVPPGPLDAWTHPPFSATELDGKLFGRGAADMKGAIATMIFACQAFLKQHSPQGSIGFLITSNEESSDNSDGTLKVIERLEQRGEKIDYCIVGEASSLNTVGDSIKIGRRGSLSGFLKIKGKQGHIAYPDKAKNAIHEGLPFLKALIDIKWDQGNSHFPPSSLQLANARAGTGALNVIPGEMTIDFNLRYSPEITVSTIKEKILALLEKYHLDYSIDWLNSATPFLTRAGKLTKTVCEVIQETRGIEPQLATDGGTSDARFIAPTGTEVIELGVRRQSIHEVNEHVEICDLDILYQLYLDILIKLLKDKHE